MKGLTLGNTTTKSSTGNDATQKGDTRAIESVQMPKVSTSRGKKTQPALETLWSYSASLHVHLPAELTLPATNEALLIN